MYDKKYIQRSKQQYSEDVNKENDLLVMFPASRRFDSELDEAHTTEGSSGVNFEEMFPASKVA